MADNDYYKVARDYVVSVSAYVKNWYSKAKNAVQIYLDPKTKDVLDKKVMKDGKNFLDNLNTYIEENNKVLKGFFKDKPDFLKEVAQNAAKLSEELDTDHDLVTETIKVSLYQQVLYCDDSGSMKREGRWESQRNLVKKITEITTRYLPIGEGVSLFFINQEVNPSKMNFKEIEDTLQTKTYSEGDTEIGTNLKKKILEPLVYREIEKKTLDRPLLITVITDGMPEPEDYSTFVDAIKECGQKLKEAKYPHQSVRFLVGQIGSNKKAAAFLETIKKNEEIADLVFCAADQLDAEFEKFRENAKDLDRWLTMTLSAAITSD